MWFKLRNEIEFELQSLLAAMYSNRGVTQYGDRRAPLDESVGDTVTEQVWSAVDSGKSVAISKDSLSASAQCSGSSISLHSHRAISATKLSAGQFSIALRLQGEPGSMLTQLTRVGLCDSSGETWSYDSSGMIARHCGKHAKSESYGPAFGLGDVIVVNYRDGQVSFTLNGVDLGIKFRRVHLPLRAFADCTCTVTEWTFLGD
jgi:hypothetical protein